MRVFTDGTIPAPGIIASQGYNLSTDNGGGFLTGTADQINTNPLLAPLGNNGGPTMTHHPLLSSPVIDKGGAVTPTALIIDQRGSLRPYDFTGMGNAPGGNGSDIGSVEVQQPTAAGVDRGTCVDERGPWYSRGVCNGHGQFRLCRRSTS
ncbi:MAG: hypothetical protein IPK98_09735 [Chloracidobacterium sp.]|nr:hypothetical protein [Chloracidobacterium sp.]